MKLTDEQIEEMVEDIVDGMTLKNILQYVYDDLIHLNKMDDDVARENWEAYQERIKA